MDKLLLRNNMFMIGILSLRLLCFVLHKPKYSSQALPFQLAFLF
jgi:hypothetical protein